MVATTFSAACSEDSSGAPAVDAGAPDAPDGSGEASPCVRSGAPKEDESVRDGAIFSDASLRTVHPCFMPYEPAFALWTDGRPAHRFLYLPQGKTIDASDLDHWQFPVGTRALKQYVAEDGRPIELRVVERTDAGFRMGTYVYGPDGSDARYTEIGGRDQLGLTPPHDIPSSAQCGRCHGGEPGRFLGLSAVQLGRGGSPSLAELQNRGLIAVGDVGQYRAPPGDEIAWRAMGELHVNCSHCHSPTAEQAPLGLVLRLEATAWPLAETALWSSAVGKPLTSFSTPGATLRIAPGDPAASGIFIRLSSRGTPSQMPVLGTRVRSEDLERTVGQWIRDMPH